ncbi:MAG: flippase-like domain-containing protein [Acidobacteria bacterium]|nr:flippase-like domain-containing protein [Acidobacteriota bacterium]
MNSTSSTTARPAARSNSRLRWLAYLLALAGLLWVLHDIHPEKVLHDLRGIRWGWVVLGIVLDLLSYVVQGVRWRLLLSSFARVRIVQTVRAIYAGLFANEILPLRSGELLRAFLVSRDTRIGFTQVLTTIGVERLMDGIVLATALGAVSVFVTLPGELARAAKIFGAVILTLSLLFVAGMIYLNRVPVLPAGAHPLRHRIRKKLAPFLDGVRLLGVSTGFYAAAGISPLIPILQILALWSMNRAYGIDLAILPVAAVLLIINFGVALPNAPANVGSYQFFCVLGLTLFGVEKTRAAGFSIVAYLLMTIPFLFCGFFALARSGLSVAEMRAKTGELFRTPTAPPGDDPGGHAAGFASGRTPP